MAALHRELGVGCESGRHRCHEALVDYELGRLPAEDLGSEVRSVPALGLRRVEAHFSPTKSDGSSREAKRVLDVDPGVESEDALALSLDADLVGGREVVHLVDSALDGEVSEEAVEVAHRKFENNSGDGSGGLVDEGAVHEVVWGERVGLHLEAALAGSSRRVDRAADIKTTLAKIIFYL